MVAEKGLAVDADEMFTELFKSAGLEKVKILTALYQQIWFTLWNNYCNILLVKKGNGTYFTVVLSVLFSLPKMARKEQEKEKNNGSDTILIRVLFQ